MNLRLLDKFCEGSEENFLLALTAIDKLIKNKNEGTTYYDDVQSTLCSSACSKRSIYSIFEELKLIDLIKYDEEADSKYYQIIDENELLSVKTYLLAKHIN